MDQSIQKDKNSNPQDNWEFPLICKLDLKLENFIDISKFANKLTNEWLRQLCGAKVEITQLNTITILLIVLMIYFLQLKRKNQIRKERDYHLVKKIKILKMYFLQSLSYAQIFENTGITYSSIYRVVNDYKNNNDNTSDWFEMMKFYTRFTQISSKKVMEYVKTTNW